MTGPHLPRDHHVIRYVKFTGIEEDGSIGGLEFRLRPHRPDETGLSVNWLEYFDDLIKAEQVQMVRETIQLKKLGKNARFAELNVGQVTAHLIDELDALVFVHDPKDAVAEFGPDLSHSEIRGLPPGDSARISQMNS